MQNKQATYQTISKLFGKNPDNLLNMPGGSKEKVYCFEIFSRKFIFKYIPSEYLYNEIYFFEEAKKVGITVPEVYHFGNISNELSFYIIDFIKQDKLPYSDIKNFITKLVYSLKQINQIAFNGFGKIISKESDRTKFEFDQSHDYIKNEINRLYNFFVNENKNNEIIKILEMIKNNYYNFIPNNSLSHFVHGDLSFRNLIYNNGEVYFIDPGPNRAMMLLWEFAYFDYKFLMHPKKDYISKLFRDTYFPHGISIEQEYEMSFYRIINAIEEYRWCILKGFNKNKSNERLMRNSIIFKNAIS